MLVLCKGKLTHFWADVLVRATEDVLKSLVHAHVEFLFHKSNNFAFLKKIDISLI